MSRARPLPDAGGGLVEQLGDGAEAVPGVIGGEGVHGVVPFGRSGPGSGLVHEPMAGPVPALAWIGAVDNSVGVGGWAQTGLVRLGRAEIVGRSPRGKVERFALVLTDGGGRDEGPDDGAEGRDPRACAAGELRPRRGGVRAAPAGAGPGAVPGLGGRAGRVGAGPARGGGDRVADSVAAGDGGRVPGDGAGPG